MNIETTLTDHSERVKAAKDEAVARALEAVGIHLEGEAKDELENDPRRVDTGRLKGSISHAVQDRTLFVGTNVEYAPYVHEGTARMKPNRFLRNAFERNMSQIETYIKNELADK